MKRRSLYLAMAILLVTPPALAAAESILGEWVAVERSKEGLGSEKTYGKDGSVLSTHGSLVVYRYNLTGKKLLLSAPGKEPEVYHIELNGASLILKDLAENRQKLTRIAGGGKAGIVGKWRTEHRGDHRTGERRIMHFTAARNCYLSVPIVSIKGKYLLAGDTITETYKGREAEKGTWSINEDVLTITSLGEGKAERYKRRE